MRVVFPGKRAERTCKMGLVATSASVLAHKMNASFLAGEASVEDAFAAHAGGEQIDTEQLKGAISGALTIVRLSGDLPISEMRSQALKALRFAESVKILLEAMAVSESDPLFVLYDEFAEAAEDIALATDPDVIAELDKAAADALSGNLAAYADHMTEPL